jgi:hypothetical protein
MMNNRLKHATFSAFFVAAIVLINTDLSCLKTYLKVVAKAMETREHKMQYEQQRYAVILPDTYLLSVKKDVYEGMSTYVHSTVVDIITVNNFQASQGADCRGSPLNRSP